MTQESTYLTQSGLRTSPARTELLFVGRVRGHEIYKTFDEGGHVGVSVDFPQEIIILNPLNMRTYFKCLNLRVSLM